MLINRRDSAVGTVTRPLARQPTERGLIFGTCNRFLLSPELPERLWRPPSLLFSGYKGLSVHE